MTSQVGSRSASLLLTMTRLAAVSGSRGTGRSSGSPSRRSWPWSPSRSSCSPTPPSSATSAPPRWPRSASRRSVLQTAIGLCVFLAYGTTASVARQLGAGDLRGALTQGVDGVWLAVVHRRRRHRRRRRRSPARWSPLFGASDRGDRPGRRPTCGSRSSAPSRCWSCWPRPACCAASRTPAPRWSSRSAGNALNIVLNLVLVYPVGLGIAGSALGSVLAQVASAAAFVVVVVRAARRHGAPLRPDLPGIRARRPGRRAAGGPHPHPARGAAGDDVRRDARPPSAPATRRSTWRPTSSR